MFHIHAHQCLLRCTLSSACKMGEQAVWAFSMDDRCCPARTVDTICHTDGGRLPCCWRQSWGGRLVCSGIYAAIIGGFFVGTSLHHSLYIKEGLYMMLALFCVSVFYCISTIYLLFLAIPCNIKYAKKQYLAKLPNIAIIFAVF